MKKQKRIAFVYPNGNIDSVPCLYNTVLLLAQNGYWVDVFTYHDDNYVRPQFSHNNISMLPLDILAHNKRPWFYRPLPGRVYKRLDLLLRHQQIPYIAVVGVEPSGLIVAETYANWLKVPLIYFSLELLLSYEVQTEEENKLKEKERTLSQQAVFTIIQDQERAELLMRDNHIPANRIICVPNGPLRPANPERTNYLRERFSLSPSAKIILHPGSLGAWVCSHQLLYSTREWPEDWVLICHTRFRTSSIHWDYLESLKYLAHPERVIFSTEPVAQEDYHKLIRSADIGIAFYAAQPNSIYQQDNIRYIGLSSGKFSYYLWAGIPTLVNDGSTLRNLVAAYECGKVTIDPAQTRSALMDIFTNYETYQNNALNCFNQEFDFRAKFDQVLLALSDLK